jgi:hypothetical protein
MVGPAKFNKRDMDNYWGKLIKFTIIIYYKITEHGNDSNVVWKCCGIMEWALTHPSPGWDQGSTDNLEIQRKGVLITIEENWLSYGR